MIRSFLSQSSILQTGSLTALLYFLSICLNAFKKDVAQAAEQYSADEAKHEEVETLYLNDREA